jgi:hypothetical protein
MWVSSTLIISSWVLIVTPLSIAATSFAERILLAFMGIFASAIFSLFLCVVVYLLRKTLT